jgi:hypothetical protein
MKENKVTGFTTKNRVIITLSPEEKEFFLNHIETSPTRLMKWAIKEYKAGLKEVQ